MEDLMNVASYIYNRYESENGVRIDEMKLHKLMYFSQRESLVQNNEPLFDGVFYGWKFGPVLKEIRVAYRENSFYKNVSVDVVDRMIHVMNKVFEDYSRKDSWSLSRLTHGELAWKNSRIGISDDENSDNPMKLEDIREDAKRIRQRREMLSSFGLI